MPEILSLLKVFVLAMTPVGELRAAIPVGMAVYHLGWLITLLTAASGNIFIALILLLLLNPTSRYLSKKSILFRHFFEKSLARTSQKTNRLVKKYGVVGLALFVGIPLPFTGAWTGCLAAFFFKFSLKKALASVSLGVIMAGIIVTLATHIGISLKKYFGLTTLAIVIALLTLVFLANKIKNYVKSRPVQKI